MNHESVRAALVSVVDMTDVDVENFTVEGETLDGATVARFEVQQDLADEIADDIKRAIKGVASRQLLDYDPSYQTSTSQALVEDLDEVPALAMVDATIRRGDVPTRESDGAQLVAMAHVLAAGTTKVVAYRLKGPGITALKATTPLLPRGGVYEQLTDALLFYEPRFDAFTVDGFTLFTTATLIQRKLLADDKAKELARATLKDVTSNVTIEGYDALEQAVVDDPTLRAKMAQVARLVRSDPSYAAYLTTDKLVEFVEKNQDFDIPISSLNGAKVLRFNPSPQHRHQIPRLLADDYLHSQLTDRNYEAGSKQRVTQ